MMLSRLLLSLFLISGNPSLLADQVPLQFTHDGKTRAYYLHLPVSYDRNRPLPLLLVLHGRSGNGRKIAQLSAFNKLADRHGFIAVYPDSVGSQWNYLHGIAGAPEGADDPGFLSDLIDKISADYNIDRSRRYVTGISNGGFMAQRLGCGVDRQFAGFASIAAGGYAAMPASCRRDGPLDALYVHGTADKLVPWQGLGIRSSDGSEQLVTLSITQSLKYWSNHNHCSPEVSVSDLLPRGQSPGTSVSIFASRDCAASADVRLYAVIGGGHNWPGVANAIAPSIAGRVNLDIHASEVVWSFFDRKYSNP